MAIEATTLVKAEVGPGTFLRVIDIVTRHNLGDDRKFSVEATQNDDRFYAKEFDKLSEAFTDFHRFLMTDYAVSVFVTDCEDEEAFAPFV